MLPPLRVIRAGLHRATEAIAAELARPGHAAHDWNDLDWKLAMAAAAAHGVAPLLCRRSRWDHPGWTRFLGEQRDHVAHRHRRIEALLDDIDARARASGIAIVPLKGAALHALGAYAPGDRPMADIDLLVRKDDVDPATRLLCDLGHVHSFDSCRHRVFKPATGSTPVALGDHRDTPVNIELHTRIREWLPVSVVDITGWIHPGKLEPGLRPYPSHSALLAHLLLHAAGNMCARSLRLIHLHDIALLARSMRPAEWDFLWNHATCWWALPPLRMVARYYRDTVPGDILSELALDCPPWLRMAIRRQTLTQVSCSDLWLHAFPGIEWSRSVSEAVQFVAGRIKPSAEKIRERADMARTQLWLNDQHWVTATQRRRILTGLTHHVPRMDMMFAVRAALNLAEPTPDSDASKFSASRRVDETKHRRDTAGPRCVATSPPPQP